MKKKKDKKIDEPLYFKVISFKLEVDWIEVIYKIRTEKQREKQLVCQNLKTVKL